MAHDVNPALLHMRQHARNGHMTGDTGSIPIAALIAGLGLYELQADPTDRINEVFENHLRGAAGQHAVPHILNVLLVRLAEICSIGYDFDPLFYKPVGDRATIKATGYGQHDFLVF